MASLDRFIYFKAKLCVKWGSEILPFKIRKHLKSRLFEDGISNGPFFKASGYHFSHSFGPYHSKSGHFCPDFKQLGFQILDPFQNLDHLQTNFFLTIQNSD